MTETVSKPKPDYPLKQIKELMENYDELRKYHLPKLARSDAQRHKKNGTDSVMIAVDTKVDIQRAMRESLTPRELLIINCIYDIALDIDELSYILNISKTEMLEIERVGLLKMYANLNYGEKYNKV